MEALKIRSVLAAFTFLSLLNCEAQSNVYSLSIYSAGTSYSDFCSIEFPFPPYRYRIEQVSWYEDTNGFTIMDIHKMKAGISQSYLQIECGSNSFSIPLESVSPKSKKKTNNSLIGIKGSGDLANVLLQCVAGRGGRVMTNAQLVAQANWVRYSRDSQDVIIVDGDSFAEVAKFLERVYGAPDTTIRSSAPIGNGRSVTYTPKQIGVLLNLTSNFRQTIVSVIGEKKQ